MRDTKNNRGRDADDSVRELSFDDERTPPPRTGDPRIKEDDIDPEISDQRVREAGRTGAEANRDATADDLTPETLLDEYEGSGRPNDKKLRVVEGAEIGGGFGKDEAELANEQGAPE